MGRRLSILHHSATHKWVQIMRNLRPFDVDIMFTDLYGSMHESSEHEGDGCIWHVSPTASHKAQGKQLAAV